MSGGRQSGKDIDEQAVRDRQADLQKQAAGEKQPVRKRNA